MSAKHKLAVQIYWYFLYVQSRRHNYWRRGRYLDKREPTQKLHRSLNNPHSIYALFYPEKPINPALIRITTCDQTGCECIVCVSNPSLMMGLCKASEEAKLARHSPNKQVCRPLRSPCTNADYRLIALVRPTPCLSAPQFKADIFLCPQEKFS